MKNKNFGVEEEITLAPKTTNNLESSSEISINEPSQADDTSKRPEIARVHELRELRKENLKVFKLSDGTEQAVFYSNPVHAFDDEMQSFEEMNDTVSEEDGRHLVCKKGHFVAKFSKECDNDELFSIENGMNRVAVYSRKNKKNRNTGVVPKIHKKSIEETSSSEIILYKGIETETDYEYSVEGDGVKENIIVNSKSNIYRYPFILHCENVTPDFDEASKRIAFISNETGEEVFFIPAPFMSDANGVISTNVSYEMKKSENGDFLFTVTADNEWMEASERAFPVVIDPQIKLSGTAAVTTYSWNAGSLYSSSAPVVGTTGNGDGNCNSKRMYIALKMPTLPRNPRIKKAELVIKQKNGTVSSSVAPKMALYRVTESIVTGSNCTPVNSSDIIDFAVMQSGTATYTFDITTLIDQINKGEVSLKNLVLKMIDETENCNNSITLYGYTASSTYAPQIIVTYESSYGVNTSYRTHTHELGRFGQGSVDLQCGNLMFESEDFVWAGNRMPVTIKHLFNSALAGYTYTNNSSIKLTTAVFSAMKLGYGFKLNLMQSMVSASFLHEGVSYNGYIFVGENGEETYFKESDTQVCCDSNSQCYNLFEDVNGGDMLYDPVKLTLKQGEDTYHFDASGRLIKITDASENHMVITYTSDRITSVTDGAGREFGFVYNANGQLTSITAPDGTYITYAYTNDLLTSVVYPDGKKAVIAYSSSKPTSVTLKDTGDNQVYKVAYSFNGNRLYSVTEYGSNDSVGAKSTYSYSVASARTLITTTEQKDTDEGETANNVITTTYTFDDDGNIVSEYVYSTDTGKVGGDGEESGINPHSGDGGAGVVSNINNLLTGHNFESLSAWSEMPGNCDDIYISNYAYEPYTKFGKKLLRMQSYNADCSENGVYQTTNSLPKGKYTFSVYLRVLSTFIGTNPGAFIRVTDTSDNILGVSELLTSYDSEYTRLIVPFELSSAQSVKVQIVINGKGTIYADAAQLENNPYANAYNMLENGNFECGTSGWTCETAGVYSTTGTCFNMSKALYMSGSISSDRYAYQDVTVRTSRATRETFTLSGWAKGYGLPNHERDNVTNAPRFRLRAVIQYYDTVYKEYGSEEFTADFSPCTEEWQFASIQFSKSKYRTIQYIRVYCDYGYNSGTAYFDDIQLIRNSIETGLAASDFVVESTGSSDEETTESNDSAPTFSEAKDKFGNALTETTFTDGDFGTIYRAFKFNSDDNSIAGDDAGNNLVEETDARGHKTSYTVDGDTSRNEEVTDRNGNKTAYEYDDSGKTTKVTSKDANGNELANVSYAYDTFDNMTEIARGDGMKYTLAYNEFHNLESIGIDGKSEALIKYAYKNGNGRLKQMTYANGHTMKATYNSIGQMVAEAWFDANNVETARYKYVYDDNGNIVRSIDITAKKEYNYEHEEGRIVRATEADISLSGEIVISKVIVNTVKYYYDTEGKMTKKVITPAIGSAQTIYYETNDDNTIVKFSAGGRTVTSHSKTDSFGRKVFDELQLGTDFVSRQFVYHAGKVTTEHKEKAKVKSSATTQLVSQIILSDGRTIAYEYDAEERITKVTDSFDGITEYTYDALGQLLTETITKNGVSTVVNSMKYDNYGNIVEKNGKAYTYGDAKWKDLLTGFDGKTIEYDAQGNPVKYLGHTLTWKNGRELKSFDGNTYTYNSNGVRTSKTVNGILHTYTLDGTKILRESWNGNTIIPIYDNEDSICGILYNSVPYYFIKNLQGDVIAIVDKDAHTVAKYSYDAWGVCTITHDSVGIANINPFRYRSYYFDDEIGLYYISSRYYNSTISRWLNSDEVIFALIQNNILQHNCFAYCCNDSTNMIDFLGFIGAEAAALKFIASYGLTYSGVAWGALLAKLSAFLSWIAPYLLIALLAIAALLLIYFAIKSSQAQRTKTLPDVKAKKQSGKHYYLAYITNFGGMCKVGKKLSFIDALAALGISGATNSINQRFTYNRTNSSSAQRQLEHKGSGYWGIYADSQSAAKALAIVFGYTAKPEVHASGMYGHYHDSTHTFHIWYGGKISY